MHTYLIMPEGCRWTTARAASPEIAYSSECYWYAPETKIAVLDMETGVAAIYTRTLDGAGNVLNVAKEV